MMTDIPITIKQETDEDFRSIYTIHKQAFDQNNEAELILQLRQTKIFDSRLSLIAFYKTEAVGHILFYPLILKTKNVSIQTLGLVPLAVKPQFQNQGIGSFLVKEGLKRARNLDYKSVFVVGNPEYYKRFGFSLFRGITNNIGVSPDHFMALELVTGSLKNIEGKLIYPPEFNLVI